MKLTPWPMNLLTRPTGSSGIRKLRVHPKALVDRSLIHGSCIDESAKFATLDIHKLFIEKKSSGHRYFLCRDTNGIYHMYGRRQNKDLDFVDIISKLSGFKYPKLPCETCLDGELTWEGHPDSEVSTCIAECPSQLSYTCFGLPILESASYIDVPYLYMAMREDILRLTGSNITRYDMRSLPPDDSKCVSMLLKRIKILDVEGFVLKRYGYSGWYKLKGNMEMDCFCTGFKISDSSTRNGMVTSIAIGYMDDAFGLTNLGYCSGFSLSEIEKMTSEYNIYGTTPKNSYMFRTVRVMFQEVASQGLLKHTSFDGWRDDKNYLECDGSELTKTLKDE